MSERLCPLLLSQVHDPMTCQSEECKARRKAVDGWVLPGCQPLTDGDTGVTYRAWYSERWGAVGWQATHPDGHNEYLYLVPSSDGGGDPEHTSCVFAYQGDAADPNIDGAVHFYDMQYPDIERGYCQHCGKFITRMNDGAKWRTDDDLPASLAHMKRVCDKSPDHEHSERAAHTEEV